MISDATDRTSSKTRSDSQEIQTECTNCPLCAANDYDSLLKGSDRLHGLGGEFSLVRCRNCDLVYLNPRPTREEMGNLYPQDYQPHSRPKEKARNTTDKLDRLALTTYYGYPDGALRIRSRAWRVARKIVLFPLYLRLRANRKNARILPFVGCGKLLDVGCGSGRFLSFAQRYGWNAHGIDTSPQAVDYAGSLGLNVALGDLVGVQLEDNSFDVVRMWHVLEHFCDPLAELREAHRILKGSGMLVTAVPNIESFAARRFRERWFHLDIPRHLCNFSTRTIKRMLSEAGLDVISVKYDRGASGIKGSLRYLAADGKLLAGILAERKYILRLLNLTLTLFRQGDVIIVYAKKK